MEWCGVKTWESVVKDWRLEDRWSDHSEPRLWVPMCREFERRKSLLRLLRLVGRPLGDLGTSPGGATSS